MAKFEMYEKRKFRRFSLVDTDGVYCVVADADSQDKSVTVSAVEFSQMGFKLAVLPKRKVDFFERNNLILKAIVGSRNLTFEEPIAFEPKWQNLDLENGIVYVGCMISDITSETEKQFISFLRSELKLGGKTSLTERSGLGN